MKIGLLAPAWLPVPPPLYGGTEAVIDRLARGLVAAGQEVLLFTTGDSTCPVPRAWALEACEPARIGNVTVELRQVMHGYEALRACDLVHDHTVLGPVYAGGREVPPVVTTNHGPFNPEMIDVFAMASRSAAVVAISHAQAASARDVPIAAVIHHGIDTHEFTKGEGEGGYLLFLGRMAPDKGPRRAVLVAREAGMPLILAAKMREPMEIEYFNSQVRPMLGGDIQFIGEVGGTRKAEWLRGAVALVNPIRWPEPFGLVMIEALACGTPVLAFAEGAAPEIVEDGVTGFICRDVQDMAHAVRRIAEIDRNRCRAAAETRFSTERMVGDHLRLFTDVLQRAS